MPRKNLTGPAKSDQQNMCRNIWVGPHEFGVLFRIGKPLVSQREPTFHFSGRASTRPTPCLSLKNRRRVSCKCTRNDAKKGQRPNLLQGESAKLRSEEPPKSKTAQKVRIRQEKISLTQSTRWHGVSSAKDTDCWLNHGAWLHHGAASDWPFASRRPT